MNEYSGYDIRELMKKNNVKPSDIAAKEDVSRATVSLVMHGKAVSARIRGAISKAAGKSTAELWPKKVNR